MQANKENLIEIINETINKERPKFENDSNSGLWAANDYYNKLVENGTIKKKGNTLRDIATPNCFYVRPNSH